MDEYIKNMKKIFITILGMTSFSISAQSKLHPWSIGIDANLKEYKGELGNGFLKFNPLNVQPGIGVSRYLNKNFDVSLFANYGKMRYNGTSSDTLVNPNLTFQGLYASLNGQFKLNNGWIMPEESKFGPYITAGLGYMHGKSTETFGGKTNVSFLTIPVGIGAKYQINDRFSMYAQSAYNIAFTDKIDGTSSSASNDRIWEHKIGVAYSFGKSKSDAQSKPDADHDGIEDSKDRCPNTPKKAKVDKFGCEIISTEANTQLNSIIQNIYFETGSATLKAESNTSLDQVVEIMNRFPSAKLIVEGHTDNTGSAENNKFLSQSRANAVKTYLESKGIAALRITAVGYGDSMPVQSNDTQEGRTANRRVELILTK